MRLIPCAAPSESSSPLATRVLLGGLTAFLVMGLSSCGGGGGGSSDAGGGSGGEDDDTDAPLISNLGVQVLGPDRVSVEWTTDESASGGVDYGLTANLGESEGGTDIEGLTHAVVLDGLQASTTYHFVVESVDASGNVARSNSSTFISGGDDDPSISGSLVQWHPLALTMVGPFAAETDTAPNPFLDYRFLVEFKSPSGQTTTVPGYFAGDGGGAASGDRWRAHYAPEEAGNWTWTARFRSGVDVALSLDATNGQSAAFDGDSGSFAVQALDPLAPGFLKWGRLEYVGAHYLRFRDGPYFLKTGLSSPENFLAYGGFDGTLDQGGASTSGLTNGLHRYGSHVADWGSGGLGNAEDPNFSGEGSVDGKGVIGALNYLASRGVNSLSIQVMNLGGDGQDTWPYVVPGSDENALTHFDLSKLDQWNVVFEHAQELGIALELVLADDEAANVATLDGGGVGRHRALLVRELVARFGHLLALEWNTSEGGSMGVSGSQAVAALLSLVDAYGHAIGSSSADMTAIGDDALLSGLLGGNSHAALAGPIGNAGGHVELWRQNSAQANQPWVVTHATQDPVAGGLSGSNAEHYRRTVLWDVLLSGGHVEYSAGPAGNSAGDDLTLEDFRTRETSLDFASTARQLLESYGSFWEMSPDDDLLSGESSGYGGGEVFAEHDETYLVYLPIADQVASLDLSGTTGDFTQSWFNPRSGQFEGSTSTVQGGGVVSLGLPPDASTGGSGDGPFEEEDGLVVMQIESATRIDYWGAANVLPGFTGSSYYFWFGPDFYNSPGIGTLTYEIDVTNSGTFFLSIYNYHDDPEPDKANDCWVRMDGGTWYKVYSNLGTSTVGVWNWSSRFDHTGQDAQYTLGVGQHTLEISGRSAGYHMDRVHLHQASVSNPFDLNLPESDRGTDGGTTSDQDWVIGLTK